VRIDHGVCTVEQGFADRADVRYTADARMWCGMALGLLDVRDLFRRGLMTKDGTAEAMDHYFAQVAHLGPLDPETTAELLEEYEGTERKGEDQ
jgi:hypothetical protein